MSLKIVSGGTTDAADGTLVTSGSKFAFAALDGVVDLHVRCDDDTYSTDSTLTVPSDGDFEVSFDGGSVWKDSADNPIPVATGIGLGGTDIGDLNFPIKVRQHASTATVSGQFTSDGTFNACTALADVTSFAVALASATSLSVSWAAVTNRTRYQVDRATNSGFTTGVTLGVYTGTGTSFTDSGLTSGTTYYYRIKAVGTYRYKDSASYATGNATPVATGDTFAGTDLTLLTAHTPTDSAGAWTQVSGTGVLAKLLSNRLSIHNTIGTTQEYELSQSQPVDCATEADIYVASAVASYVLITARHSGVYASQDSYRAYLTQAGVLNLDKRVSGSGAAVGSYNSGSALVALSTHTIRLECIGTAIKVYWNGVLRINVTDSSVTAAGTRVDVELYNSAPASGGTTGLHLDALRT